MDKFSILKHTDHDVPKLKDGNGNLHYRYLPRVMLGIQSILQANAECKCIFSIVRKNHTEYRSSMGMKNAEMYFGAQAEQTPMIAENICEIMKSSYYESMKVFEDKKARTIYLNRIMKVIVSESYFSI